MSTSGKNDLMWKHTQYCHTSVILCGLVTRNIVWYFEVRPNCLCHLWPQWAFSNSYEYFRGFLLTRIHLVLLPYCMQSTTRLTYLNGWNSLTSCCFCCWLLMCYEIAKHGYAYGVWAIYWLTTWYLVGLGCRLSFWHLLVVIVAYCCWGFWYLPRPPT